MTWHICHKKNYFFVRISTYLPVFLLKFWARGLVGCRIQFHIQWVPTLHIFYRRRYPKNKKCLKNVVMTSSSCFLGISFFGGIEVHQKYVVWARIGCRIKFHIQWALPLRIWVKTQGDMSKIQTKSSFFHSSSKINKYYFISLPII